MFTKKNILKKTFQVGGLTMLSRVLGILRETLLMRYLGPTALASAFLTAYKIPNSLRKIFAEGALSAAFVPSVSAAIHDRGKDAVNGLMTIALLIFEGFVLLMCALGIVYAHPIIATIAPGFTADKVAIGAQCLRIVMPFIFFVSSSALFAGALQAVGHFFVPAVAPVLLNIIFIGTLFVCMTYNLYVTYLCWGILLGGALQFLLHVAAYVACRFNFAPITTYDMRRFGNVLLKFFLCLPSVSIMEFSLFIDTSFASYLHDSSIPLIYLANRFMGIPLGVFAVAFATVLLPHFSRVARYAPKRLSFYILEGAKLVFWVSLPVAVLMWFFADNIFETLFASGKNFTPAHVHEGASVLRAFVAGLFFYSLNKVVLNVYYALHIAWVPALISCIAAVVNIVLDWFFIDALQSVGLAFATTCSALVRTVLFLVVLRMGYNQKIYVWPLMSFMLRYSAQVALFLLPFWGAYTACVYAIQQYVIGGFAHFLLHKIGFWLWVGPLALCFIGALWATRSLFYKRLYFID